jgi:hypothetical protein
MIELFRRKPQWRSFDQDVAQYPSLQRHDAGLQVVSLDRIVGSLGRHGASVLSEGRRPILSTNQRSRQIRELMRRGYPFDTVELYALNGVYYVVDGNHRVAAARSLRQLAIDAHVIEFRPVSGETQESAAWCSIPQGESTKRRHNSGSGDLPTTGRRRRLLLSQVKYG